ncbi:hypothetical protein QVD17_39855 [Tagetes erecta]|uniref:Uncharacterized protein n=1 Tax=Tagetes erecta TaxID=13708 RepID=A0AAD8JV99_TARER|nr:hypothetical protein QVD17_39855 [Tagetes erecta]
MSSPGIIVTNSSSDDFELNFFKFIESFPNPPRVIHFGRPWVFCTQSKNTPSVVLGTPMHIIHNYIF